MKLGTIMLALLICLGSSLQTHRTNQTNFNDSKVSFMPIEPVNDNANSVKVQHYGSAFAVPHICAYHQWLFDMEMRFPAGVERMLSIPI